MRWWFSVLLMMSVPRTSHADEVCLFGTCGEIGEFNKSRSDPPPERERSDGDSSGPSRPQGPRQRTLQDQRWAADLYRQGKAAADRKKYDDAIRHFEKSLALGNQAARPALAAAQHKKALGWYAKKQLLAARWLMEKAAANDPQYAHKVRLIHERWCRDNRPLFPPNLSDGNDELRFDDTAIRVCQSKVDEAKRNGWQCAWSGNECMRF